MPMQTRSDTLPFTRSKTTVAIEQVDESWALELINEAEREEFIRVEGIELEVLKAVDVEVKIPFDAAANCARSVQARTDREILVKEETGPTAIEIQKILWAKRSALSGKPNPTKSGHLLPKWFKG